MQNLPSVKILQTESKSSPDLSLACLRCNLVFTTIEDLAIHEEPTPSLPSAQENQCELCNQVFSTYRGMRQHIGKVHSSNRKVKCKYCSKKFKDNYAVKYHRKQVHEKSTQVECFLCGKILYNQFNYKKHLTACQEKFFDGKAKEIVDENI